MPPTCPPSRSTWSNQPGAWSTLAGTPNTLDTRDLALRDVTAVGILGGSAGLAGAIEAYADDSVDARPLVATTVGLAETAEVLARRRPENAGPGPKIHIDPRR
ncbi:hypothetical protein ACTWPT_39875 [Nonomuraea sp. 3N208]|uniref:hypothetical protein n=1 Tax=Nonomuraea sp. 3N208 TaxID=3457421 RepID=UPI003FD480E6